MKNQKEKIIRTVLIGIELMHGIYTAAINLKH